MTYSRENKYEGRYLVKERLSKYIRQQQRHSNVKGRTLGKTNNSRDNNVEKRQDDGRFRSIGRNMKKQH